MSDGRRAAGQGTVRVRNGARPAASRARGVPDGGEWVLISEARRGDGEAFRRLVDPHRRAIHLHCYRMLGSLHDAEDLAQETLLRAWRGLGAFRGRASFRTWLYRIATNACLDAIRRRPRRLLPDAAAPATDPAAPVVPPVAEPIWLEPYPDALIDEAADPEARYETRESVALAFLAAIQHLPGRQRAVLILRDVLGWSAGEAAETLGSTLASANSALQRARATLKERLPDRGSLAGPRMSAAEARALVDRYVRAWEAADVGALVALLKEGAMLTMPPSPSWYAGRAAILTFLTPVFARHGAGGLRLMSAAANRQPALALYAREPGGVFRPLAIKVLRLEGGRVVEITGFTSPDLFPRFGLPEAIEPEGSSTDDRG